MSWFYLLDNKNLNFETLNTTLLDMRDANDKPHFTLLEFKTHMYFLFAKIACCKHNASQKK